MGAYAAFSSFMTYSSANASSSGGEGQVVPPVAVAAERADPRETSIFEKW